MFERRERIWPSGLMIGGPKRGAELPNGLKFEHHGLEAAKCIWLERNQRNCKKRKCIWLERMDFGHGGLAAFRTV
jgi:hypothetical protein